jgi:hypothetical protein
MELEQLYVDFYGIERQRSVKGTGGAWYITLEWLMNLTSNRIYLLCLEIIFCFKANEFVVVCWM